MLRLLAISLLQIGCVIPYAVPPLKVEAGGTTITDDRPQFHAGGGVYLASAVMNEDQLFDVGGGGFIDVGKGGVQTSGAYFDGSMFLERSTHTRTSLGARGEARWSDMGQGLGAKLRVEREYFSTTKKGYSATDRCGTIGGVARGTGGIGVFAEAGRVWMPDQPAWTATAGITVRIPSTVGLFAGIPGCK